MGTDTVTTLSLLTLAQEYRGDIVKQINRMCSTLRMLRVVAGEGKNIAWAPQGDGALAENYSEGADADNFAQDVQAAAYLPWSLYRSNIHATSLAMDGAATSTTPEGNRQLWAKFVLDNSAKLASKINQEVFAGPGTGTTMAGLVVAVDDDNTYATVDRSNSDFAYFRSTVVDPGVDTPITMKLIRDDLRKIFEASGMQPDMAPCSPAVFAEVGALFDNTRRQIDSVRSATGEIKLDFGFQAVECDGCVFYRDKDATAKAIYYLNSDHVEIQYLPSASQAMVLGRMDEESTVTPDDGFGAIPLGFKYEMLAKTGPSEKAQVLWTGNLVVDRPNSCGVRKHVTVVS